MTSISWAFEIIEKITDMIPYSCVTFGVIITPDPSRNGRGFGASLFTRQCHLSKTKLRTKIIHLARINAAIANQEGSCGLCPTFLDLFCF
jgi:hypothetical protein